MGVEGGSEGGSDKYTSLCTPFQTYSHSSIMSSVTQPDGDYYVNGIA